MRPPTFFQRTTTADAEGQSSIDGILVNRTALTAPQHIEVLNHQDRQHRPARATFAWDRIQQVGAILQRAAKLNLENVQKADPTDTGCPINRATKQILTNGRSTRTMLFVLCF